MRGTRFHEKSFSVPASAGSPKYCEAHGHTQPDRHGKCLRCSANVRQAQVGSQGVPTTDEGAEA